MKHASPGSPCGGCSIKIPLEGKWGAAYLDEQLCKMQQTFEETTAVAVLSSVIVKISKSFFKTGMASGFFTQTFFSALENKCEKEYCSKVYVFSKYVLCYFTHLIGFEICFEPRAVFS